MKVLPLAAGAALLAATAQAQPPSQGWIGAIDQPSILCDTRAEVQSIVDAFGVGSDTGKARLMELFNRLNDKHEPTCAVVAIRLATATDATDVGLVKIADADYFGWIIHISNGVEDGYILYLETPHEALKNTI